MLFVVLLLCILCSPKAGARTWATNTTSAPACLPGERSTDLEVEEYCSERSMVRHEVYDHHSHPSYCYYGNDLALFELRGVELCGWARIGQRDCERAGCCYKDTTCYQPIRPVEIETRYHNKWVTFRKAREECDNEGMDVLCARHYDDLELVAQATCGICWLAGSPVSEHVKHDHVGGIDLGSDVTYTLPYMGDKCDGDGGKTTVEITCSTNTDASSDAFSFVLANTQMGHHVIKTQVYDKRQLLCAREVWKPTISTFPQHILYSNRSSREYFECAIHCKSTNNVLEGVRAWWEMQAENGTFLYRSNTTDLTSGGSIKIPATHIGKYTCNVLVKFVKGVFAGYKAGMGTLSAYAYHYNPASVRIFITCITRKQPRVPKTKVERNTTWHILQYDRIIFEIEYDGYPKPGLTHLTTASNETQQGQQLRYVKKATTDQLTRDSFASHVWEYEETYSEHIQLTFYSPIQHILPVHVFLKKEFLVPKEPPPPDYYTVALNKTLQLQCYGYGTGSLIEVQFGWLFNGKELEESVPALTSLWKKPHGLLLIKATSGLYSGVYQCVLGNGAQQITVNHTVKVVAPPVQPQPIHTLHRRGSLVLVVPPSTDTWNKLVYAVVLYRSNSSITGDAVDVVRELDVVVETVKNGKGKLMINYTASKIPFADVSISLTGPDMMLSLKRVMNGTKYHAQYTVSNKHGISPLSIPSAGTILYNDVNIGSIYIRAETALPDNNSISFNMNTKDHTIYGIYCHYWTDLNQIHKVSSTGSDLMKMKLYNLDSDTQYYFYVSGYKKVANKHYSGPPSRIYTLKTLPKTFKFNPNFYTPNKLIVQQVASLDNKAVVLARWKMKGDVDKQYILRYRMSVFIKNESEAIQNNKNLYKLLFTETIMPSVNSVLLRNKLLLLNSVYRFRIWCILQGLKESGYKSFSILLSESKCPVPPPKPKMCTLALKSPYQLVYVLSEKDAKKDEEDDEHKECYRRYGESYNGTAVNHSKTGKLCKYWNETDSEYKEQPENYCRNPQSVDAQNNHRAPWCFVSDDLQVEECNVEPCGQYNTSVRTEQNNEPVYNTSGKVGCIPLTSSQSTVTIDWWYDYGEFSQHCNKNKGKVTVEVHSKPIYMEQIWFKYIMMMCTTLVLIGGCWIIIHSRRRLVLKIREKKILEGRRKSLRQALGNKVKIPMKHMVSRKSLE